MLVWTAFGIVALIGFVGVAIDIGRMYIVRNEAQAFTDAGALAAAAELDGTAAGVTRANARVTQRPVDSQPWSRFDFASKSFLDYATPDIGFCRTVAVDHVTCTDPGAWQSYGSALATPAGYRYVRVAFAENGTFTMRDLAQSTVAGGDHRVPVPMTLISILTGSATSRIGAAAIAGQVAVTTSEEGLMPMSPLAHSSDPALDYGLVPGESYTIRWGSNSTTELGKYISDQADKNPKTAEEAADDNFNAAPANANKRDWCRGDVYKFTGGTRTVDDTFLRSLDAANLNDRGFIQYTSASALSDTLVSGYQGQPLSVGDSLTFTGGSDASVAKKGIGDRIVGDVSTAYYDFNRTPAQNMAAFLDPSTGYYATSPNDRRIVFGPISRPPDTGSNQILSFGAFLLEPTYQQNGNLAWCAMYLGPALLGSSHQAAGPPGLYVLRLVQ